MVDAIVIIQAWTDKLYGTWNKSLIMGASVETKNDWFCCYKRNGVHTTGKPPSRLNRRFERFFFLCRAWIDGSRKLSQPGTQAPTCFMHLSVIRNLNNDSRSCRPPKKIRFVSTVILHGSLRLILRYILQQFQILPRVWLLSRHASIIATMPTLK